MRLTMEPPFGAALYQAISQDTGSIPRTYRVNLQAVAADGSRLAAAVVCHYCP